MPDPAEICGKTVLFDKNMQADESKHREQADLLHHVPALHLMVSITKVQTKPVLSLGHNQLKLLTSRGGREQSFYLE